MKKLHWFFENMEVVFSAWWFGMAVAVHNMASVFFLMFAFHHFRNYQREQFIKKLFAMLDASFKSAEVQRDCIVTLAVRLIPFIGKEEVVKILAAHGIEVESIWKDFDDKWNGKRKGKKLEIPGWVRKLADDMRTAIEPKPALEGARRNGIASIYTNV